MKVIVFGCGLVGKTIVAELARHLDVVLTVADVDKKAVVEATEGADVRTEAVDLTKDGAARALAEDQDLAVNAVPGRLGMKILRESLEAKCMVADISFMPEDAFELDELAKEQKVPAIVDCGVAPGLSNILVGRAASKLDEVHDVKIMVGGLPVVRRLPYEYGVVFSPEDVLEEYTRPAYVIEEGREVVRAALSEPELIDVHRLGTLEAFLTDGLRTLRRTIEARNMKEKTLRYPGHRERIQLLIETGLLSEEAIEIGEASVSPRELTGRLLRRKWQLEPGDEDLTVLLVDVTGTKDDESTRVVYTMVDYYDVEKQVTSMARTTGYSCLAAVKLLQAGKVTDIGVISPEEIGRQPELCDQFLATLREDYGIVVEEVIEKESQPSGFDDAGA